MPLSLEDIVQRAERLRGSWIAHHPWILATIVAVLCSVLVGLAVDSRRGKEAAGNLKLAKEWATAYKRDIAATEREFDERLKIRDERLKIAEAKFNGLVENVLQAHKISLKPWEPPKNVRETAGRFNALGYAAVTK